MLISSSSPSFRNDRKKNQREKRKVSEGQFSHQKRRKIVERREQFYTITNGKYRGENARANTLLSINKTPNNTSSLHQISGFLRPRAALYFLSSRAALYFTKTADDDDDDDDGGERKPCLPINRENRENIFFLKGCFFSSFVSFLHQDIFTLEDIFSSRQKSKKLSLPFFCLVQVSFESSSFQEKKNSKKGEKELEREKPNHFFSPQQPLVYLFLLRATMETMNTTTNNKREGGEKDFDEEDKKRMKKDELEEDELETQETHPWSANEEILEEEVYVQDLGKVSDDVKVVEAEKKSWNRKPLARPIDGQTDSIRTLLLLCFSLLFFARCSYSFSFSFSSHSSLCALGDFQIS